MRWDQRLEPHLALLMPGAQAPDTVVPSGRVPRVHTTRALVVQFTGLIESHAGVVTVDAGQPDVPVLAMAELPPVRRDVADPNRRCKQPTVPERRENHAV